MTYNYEKRKESIEKWFNEYIKETFTSVRQFGHLECNHLNKSDKFLKKRSKEIHKDTSSFIGKESDVYEILIKIILDHRMELIEYLADLDDQDVWEVRDYMTDERVVGKKFCISKHQWRNGSLPCTEVVIAFKKNPRNLNALVITSAYPI